MNSYNEQFLQKLRERAVYKDGIRKGEIVDKNTLEDTIQALEETTCFNEAELYKMAQDIKKEGKNVKLIEGDIFKNKPFWMLVCVYLLLLIFH